jgi:hydrogenase-4 component B
MRGPMCVLSACCVGIGLGPTLVAPLLDQSVAVWTRQATQTAVALEQAAPLWQLSLVAIVLLTAVGLGAGLLQWRIRTQPLGWTETWGCGYTAPSPRMQYTASSLAQFLVKLLAWPLQSQVHRPHLDGFFPGPAQFDSHVPELVLERAVMPTARSLGHFLFWFRLVQQGSVQVYLLYIFAILIFFLLFWR